MKLYLTGFLKGFGILLIYLVFDVILSAIAIAFGLKSVSEDINIIFLVIGYAIAFYLVYKFKLEKYWNIFVLLLGVVSLPFLYGIREMKKRN